MKNIFWLVIEFCAAALCILVWGPKPTQALEFLAHSLEEVWPDNHIVADTI